MRARAVASIVVVAVLGASIGPRAWSADEKKACVDAAEVAQDLRSASKLLEAREKLIVCARDVCPKVVRKDCSQWLHEVEASTPTIVFRATKAGSDVGAVKVFVDDALLVDHLDGTAVPVDPGQHAFRFELEGEPPATMSLLVREAEKNRAVDVTFGTTESTPPTPPPPAAPTSDVVTPSTSGASSGGVPAGAIVLGVVGVAGIAGFAVLGLKGKSEIDDLRNSCAPGCNSSDVDAAKRKLLFADISLGVGVVALGAATWLLLSNHDAAPKSGAITWNVGATPRGAFAGISGAF